MIAFGVQLLAVGLKKPSSMPDTWQVEPSYRRMVVKSFLVFPDFFGSLRLPWPLCATQDNGMDWKKLTIRGKNSGKNYIQARSLA